ncbi:hypothetical protein LE841_001647, partial [Neisseria gonorrhoeae]
GNDGGGGNPTPTHKTDRKEKTMDTFLKIIATLSFAGAATLAVWLLVEAADAVLRRKREGKGEDDFDGFGY